jgi:hypothetical protein
MNKSSKVVAKQSDNGVRRNTYAKSEKASTPHRGFERQKRVPLKPTSHRFQRILFAIYVLAIIWTSVAHATEFRATRGRIPASIRLLKAASSHQQLAVRAYVKSAAKAEGVDPSVAEWIVTHESQHHPEATGDGGDSRGLWQINKAWHPEVSDACAYDVTCSTRWSLQRIHDGYVDEWSTWKYCKERFEDCPF